MAKKSPQPGAAEFQEDLADDVWAIEDAAGPGLTSRLFAEVVGTFIFMFAGLMASLLGGNGAYLLASLIWGITLMTLIVAVGRISGAHFNPAVTVGAWIAGRFPGRDVALYIVAQVTGGVAAGGLVSWFAGQIPAFGVPAGNVMSQISIGVDEHSPVQATLSAGLAMEFIVTALFVTAVLMATSVVNRPGQAPVTIGLAFAALLAIGSPFTNGALNPVRATATGLFATDEAGSHWAVSQLWWWWLVAIIAGAFVGLLVRAFGPEDDLEAIEIAEPSS